MEENVKDSTVLNDRLREPFEARTWLSNEIDSSTDILNVLSIKSKEVLTSVTHAV